jgi:phage terminase large subunit-like protein
MIGSSFSSPASTRTDDPFDPATWWKANPNLGVSLYPDFMEGQANEAKKSATALSGFQQYHLNIWTNVITKWLDMDCWRASSARPFDVQALVGLEAIGGLDLSSTTDLTAFVLLFQLPDGDIAVLPTFWLPQRVIDEALKKKGQIRLKNWLDSGFLKATPGVVVDYDFIRKDIIEQSKRFKIREIGSDPWNATQLLTQLQNDGLKIVEVRQGPPSLSGACKELERLVLQKKLRHQGHPVLTWCAGNAVVRKDANGNMAPDKERAKDKIDGIAALVNALSRIVKPEKPPGQPYLLRRGLVTLG